jgi:hypothetical protein
MPSGQVPGAITVTAIDDKPTRGNLDNFQGLHRERSPAAFQIISIFQPSPRLQAADRLAPAARVSFS